MNSYRSCHLAESTAKNYDRGFYFSDYRRFVMKWEKYVLNKIINNHVSRKENYLDFACGTGRIVSLIEDAFTNSFGIDISAAMLKVAKQKVKTAALIEQDISINNYDFKNQMDLITAFRFFLNAEPELRSGVLRQLNKALKPDGLLVFNIHKNKTVVSKFADKTAILLYKITGRHFHRQNSISITEIKELLKEHNFEIIKTYHKIIIPIINENTRFRLSQFSRIEDFFSRIPVSLYLSRNIIYVCKKGNS